MNRTLALGGLFAILALAGCLGLGAPAGPGDATPAHEALVFDHADHGSPAVEGGLSYPGGDYQTRRYVTTVTAESGTDRFDGTVMSVEASAFVANTSFSDSYLVVIQTAPASSHPDHRVESVRRAGGELHVAINDSSRGGTADVTVETVLIRVHGSPPEEVVVTTEEGETFSSSAGVVRVTDTPTATPGPAEDGDPYVADEANENVDEPRDVTVVNEGDDTNGFRVTVTTTEEPDCRDATPQCSRPSRRVTVLDERSKLRAGGELTYEDVVAKKTTYTVEVSAEVPDGEGGRRTVTESFEWTVDGEGGDLRIVVSDDGVRRG